MKDNYDDLFGTMFDFNGDGHSDMTETYMAYPIMTDNLDNNNDTYDSTPVVQHRATGGNGRFYLAIIMIVLAIIGWIYFIVSQIVSCTSSSSKSSYSYSRSYKSYSGSSSNSNSSAYSYRSKTETSFVQPTTKESTYRSYSSKSKSSESDDEYSAKEYVDADDFYYDHYDDFYDYEDAEDYYKEHVE